MGINAVTSLRGSDVADLLRTMATPSRPSGHAPAASNSTTDALIAHGITAVVSGNPSVSTDALFQSLIDRTLRKIDSFEPAEPPPLSPAEQKRQDALQSAKAKLDDGDTAGGREVAEKLLDKRPGDVGALQLIARSHLDDGAPELAESFYARISASSPEDIDTLNNLAMVRSLQRSNDEVLDLARGQLAAPSLRTEGLGLLVRLSQQDSDNVNVLNAFADGFTDAHMPRQVLGALDMAVEAADDDEIASVLTRAEEVVRKAPQLAQSHSIFGRALVKAGRYDEAIAELKTAAEIEPHVGDRRSDLAAAYIARAESKLGKGNDLSAQLDVEAARGVDPSSVAVDESLARIAVVRARRDIEKGNFVRALSKLSTARSKAPDEEVFRKKLSSLQLRTALHFDDNGDDALALTNYARALENDPTLALAKRRVGELSRKKGLEAITAKNYDKAITDLERAYATYRPDATVGQDLARAYDLRGQQLVARGRITEAIEDFKRGISLDPTDASLAANFSAVA